LLDTSVPVELLAVTELGKRLAKIIKHKQPFESQLIFLNEL